MHRGFALEGSNLRQVTRHKRSGSTNCSSARTEDFQSQDKDGTDVQVIVKPAGSRRAHVPTLLISTAAERPCRMRSRSIASSSRRTATSCWRFNYRGRGVAATRGRSELQGDWATRVVDGLAVARRSNRNRGSDRLGIGVEDGGSSTNYTIATIRASRRRSAAAGSVSHDVRHDQYISNDMEMVAPWKTQDSG